MRGLQGTFSDAAQRRLVIEAIVLIHNFRTDYVDYSQIKSVFDREISMDMKE